MSIAADVSGLPGRELPATVCVMSRPDLNEPPASHAIPRTKTVARAFSCRRVFLRSGLTGVAVALAGCDLLDQRTFNSRASRPPKVYIPPPPPGPPPIPPLIEVLAGTPPVQWTKPLQAVVRQALLRKPNILFQVRALAPPGPDADTDRQNLSRLVGIDGQAVASAIIAAGAAPEQVEMTAMPDSTVAGPRIRVYVR